MKTNKPARGKNHVLNFPRVLAFFFSMPFSLVLGFVFAVSIAAATFVEVRHGTETARALVYNARWVEILLLLAGLNLAANAVKFRMWRKGKEMVFLFHAAFMLILAGAAITRYWGDGGVMRIREGEQSNTFLSGKTYLSVSLKSAGQTVLYEKPVLFSSVTKNRFNRSWNLNGRSVRLSLVDYLPGAGKKLGADDSENSHQNTLLLEVSISGQTRMVSVFGLPGEIGEEEKLDFHGVEVGLAYGSKAIPLPFGLKLTDFRIDRYPGSMKPSGFTSDVIVVDGERGVRKPYSIFMNHILKYRGYRFYQSSFDEDEMGTVLSVSRDPGTVPTYTGYLLLGVGLVLNLFRPKSRFRMLGQHMKKTAPKGLLACSVAVLFFGASGVRAFDGLQGMEKLDKTHSRRFGAIAVQDNQGRIKPVHTLAMELIRSESRLKALPGLDANQLSLWVFTFPEEVGKSGYFQNSPPEKLFRLFPLKNDPPQRWISFEDAEKLMEKEDNAFVIPWFHEYRKSVQNGSWMRADSLLAVLENFQAAQGRGVYPGPFRLKAEVFYNRANVFGHLAPVLFWTGLALLACSLVRIVYPRRNWNRACTLFAVVLALGFLIQTGALGLRWFVSGHAPWTNKYESMIYISWSILLAGMVFGTRNRLALAGAGILSGMLLSVARMAWVDPKITTLPPVLKSLWLVIHVSVITSSYGFLGLGAVLAFFNLLFSVFRTKKTTRTLRPVIACETLAVEQILLLGLTLLTIGNFLGAAWANESWGRTWGWDPKETWTLVTILIYAIVLHLRLVPKWSGAVLFNIASVFAFGSVLMTYLGVNLYLSGMHSYAAGERPGFPVAAIAVAGVLMVMGGIAFIKEKLFKS